MRTIIFLAGLFLGVVVAVFTMAILTAASNDDDVNGRDRDDQNGR